MGTNIEYDEMIRKLCSENPTSYYNILRGTRFSFLLDYIIKESKPLDHRKEAISNRISFVLNGLKELPICANPECENHVHPISKIAWNSSWPKHCSAKCAAKDPESTRKTKETKLRKYGSENYNAMEKNIKFNIEKYGVPFFFQTNEFKEKSKTTMIKNGYDHPMHSDEIKEKLVQTNLEKYGCRYSVENKNVIRKSKAPYFHDGKYFKSSWELAYYIWLTDNHIEFTFQPDKYFEFQDEKGISHAYHPDFIVDGSFVEIKGNQFISENGEYINPYDASGESSHIYEAKRKCMIENNVRILTKENVDVFLNYCSKKYCSSTWKNIFRTQDNNFELFYDRETLESELDYYKNHTRIDYLPSVSQRNRIVKFFQQNTFFSVEKQLLSNETIRSKIINNRVENLNKHKDSLTMDDILTGFKKSGMYYGYSHFNPLWFKFFIDRYEIKTCYDPCGGWGHRLLGGLNLEKYIYNDLSKSTKENIDRIIDFFQLKNVETYNNDAKSFIPKEFFESMFTCPPYFNLEHYECGDFNDIDDFRWFLDSIFDIFKAVESCRIFGLVIREDLLFGHDNYYEKFLIPVKNSSHLNNKKKFSEYLFIFKK